MILNNSIYYSTEKEIKDAGNTKNSSTNNIIKGDQTQDSTSISINDEHVNKLIDDKIKSLREDFQLKLGIIESENKSTITNLQQEKAQKDKENKLLKEILAKLESQLKESTSNVLNYGSTESVNSGENDINYDTEIDSRNDDNNDINYDSESNDNEKCTNHSSLENTHQNIIYVTNKVNADPNCDSSDNEDPRNDLYLD
jgi:hypothetical protein